MLNLKKTNKNTGTIFSAMVILNIVFLALAIPVRAEKTVEQNNKSDYGLPTHRQNGGSRSGNSSDYGLPTHRRDGGSRSGKNSCVDNSTGSNLVALIPEDIVGINASASPKLFFYVPKIRQQKTLEFVLRNEQDELMYEAFLTTKGEGIMSVDIPADVQASLIEEDTNYHWYLSLICNSQQRSRDIVVEGWMRQSVIDVVSKKELDSSNSVAQAELYQEKGYWFDALSVLARNSFSEEEEPIIRAKWSELLESVGLEELATQPFIESELIEYSVK